MSDGKTDLVRGTLDMLILKTLTLQPMHGLGISRGFQVRIVHRNVIKGERDEIFALGHQCPRCGKQCGIVRAVAEAPGDSQYAKSVIASHRSHLL